MDWLGKLSYLQSQPFEQRQKFRTLVASIIMGLVIADVMALASHWANLRRRP